MNTAPIERLSLLLKQIEEQAIKIDQSNEKKRSHRLIENEDLFSITLFSTQSNQFTPYVKEIEHKITALNRLYTQNKIDYSKQSITVIEQQISAILNALRSNDTLGQAALLNANTKKKVRIKSIKANPYKKSVESITYSSHQLYQKLSEHHEFERRLMDMLSEKDQLRTKSNAKDNQKLSLEVLTLHQRLGRCRKAISIIEKDIAFSENKN